MAALIRDDRKGVDVKPDRLLLSARRMREEKVAFDQGGAAVEAVPVVPCSGGAASAAMVAWKRRISWSWPVIGVMLEAEKSSVSVRELGSTLKIRSSKRSVPVVSASARSRELWKDSDPTREVRAAVMER